MRARFSILDELTLKLRIIKIYYCSIAPLLRWRLRANRPFAPSPLLYIIACRVICCTYTTKKLLLETDLSSLLLKFRDHRITFRNFVYLSILRYRAKISRAVCFTLC